MVVGDESKRELLARLFGWLKTTELHRRSWRKATRLGAVLAIDPAFGDVSLGLEFELDGQCYLGKITVEEGAIRPEHGTLEYVLPDRSQANVGIDFEQRTLTIANARLRFVVSLLHGSPLAVM